MQTMHIILNARYIPLSTFAVRFQNKIHFLDLGKCNTCSSDFNSVKKQLKQCTQGAIYSVLFKQILGQYMQFDHKINRKCTCQKPYSACTDHTGNMGLLSR